MYKYIYKIVVFLLVFSSCSEERIQLSPISQDSAGDFYKTPDDIEQSVVSCYDALQSSGQYKQNFVYIMEVASDNTRQESTTSSGGVFGDIDLHRIETTNPVINSIWENCYKDIQRCNIVLNRIESVQNNPNKNVQIGEAKFIRALTYFNLVRTFGDVPLVTIEYDDPFQAFELGRTSVADVYNQIVQDLTDATQLLGNSPLRLGGVTKGGAFALLGKVQLTLKNYTEAVTALQSVSGYSLLSNYEDVFGVSNENNEESIFEVQFQKGGSGEGSPFANLFAPKGATELVGGVGTTIGDNIPTQDLFDAFPAGDLRRDASIGTASTGVLHSKKYLDTPSSDRDGDNNFIVLRYADVVLMLAEALNEQNYIADGEAFNLLNQIRNRAGLSNLTSADLADQLAFRNAIALERRLEFNLENHRWFDLVRTGNAVNVMNNHTSITGTQTITNNNLLFPIPQSQIDTTNDKITQNPGYN